MRSMNSVGGVLGLTARCLVLVAAAGLAHGAPGGLPAPAAHSDSSPEWESLREKLFQARPVDATPGTVQIVAPLRAAYGASVPVKIISKLPQKATT